MTTTNLQDAIDTSIRENRTVEIEHDGDISDCETAIAQCWDGEMDSAEENDGSYDVWGWNDETPENTQAWRLSVRCSK